MGDHPTSATSRRHTSVLGSWERSWRPAAPALRGLVAGYQGYRQRVTGPVSHRGIPSASVSLGFSFGPVQTVSSPSGSAIEVGSFIAGLHDRHVLIDAEEFHGIQVDLDPVGAYRLLGRPLHELTGITVPLDGLLGADAARLTERLATAPDWDTRFDLLDGELLRRLGAELTPDAEVAHVWRRIRIARGRVAIGALAEEVGWSPRWLNARFGAQVGLAPKRLAGLVRFETAAALLARTELPTLAEVAVMTGYYDQSHLTNDVRKHCGLTPGQLIADLLPDHGGVFSSADR